MFVRSILRPNLELIRDVFRSNTTLEAYMEQYKTMRQWLKGIRFPFLQFSVLIKRERLSTRIEIAFFIIVSGKRLMPLFARSYCRGKVE